MKVCQGKRGAEQPRRDEIDAVAERRTETAAEEDNQEARSHALHRTQAELVEQRHVAVAAGFGVVRSFGP